MSSFSGPTVGQIIDFHSNYLDLLNRKKNNEQVFCFACQMTDNLQRAHILPVNMGGSNDLHNLHILCVECHFYSEKLYEEEYKKWLEQPSQFHLANKMARLIKKIKKLVKKL